MRVLLLGKTGLLGSEFLSLLEQSDIEFYAPSHWDLDVTNFQAVDDLLAHEYFDRVLYCVAYTNVDKAEVEQGRCEMVNVKALENFVLHRCPILHFSTDYVFQAPEQKEIPEHYPRDPLNFYGKSKVLAEDLLEQSGVPFWNIRTTWLFGAQRENFITKILKASHERDVLDVVHDQVGRPTYTKDLAAFVFEHFVRHTLPKGHYHLQNTGKAVSRADLAEYVLDKKHWKGVINRINSSDRTEKALRPKNSRLLNTKLPDALRPWQEALDEYLETFGQEEA